ncbi:TAXI family TRAP transporter solute-binding subunit [Peptoniphilus catoniae]|uniref:TAXI family TRAP transporter solute-binding subunit n=1 Tax=Peptoniphilus catoniae TaxID=1660341 RepID=UPI0010FECB77|nr:TAXI family TRAP transporter solute-binding subunit [Peptoniphilus catoniae]
MRKKFKFILPLLVILFLPSCKAKEKAIRIPTASTTGALYNLGFSLSKLWTDKIGLKFNSEASNGGVDNLNIIYDKDAEVSLGVSSIVYQAYHGEGVFKDRKNPSLRIIAGLYLNPNQVVVRKDAGINSLKDLKGKNFSAGSSGSTTESETMNHLKAVCLKESDLNIQRIAPGESADLIRTGSLDGVWIMAAIPTASVTEITASSGAEILEIDRQTVDKLKEEDPWYTNYTIKAGSYIGQDKDINTSAIKMVLYTTDELSDDLVYEMTKTFWENLEELQESNKSLKGLKVEDAIKDIADLPLAEGAKRYYKEIGLIK